MPMAPKRPCTYPGCNTLTDTGRCSKHPYERTRSAKTASYKRLYNSKRWRSLRLSHLRKNPYCDDCFVDNILTTATVVDHRNPHNGNVDLFFDPTNLSSKCKHHHDKKTARHDGGFGNPKKGSGK